MATIKIPGQRAPLPTSPEALFQTLRGRAQSIRNLWSHQADILREYEKHLDAKDVALELPTGSGKTLVALLISEYRRLVKRERIAYLCPTKQLAWQVGAKATEYGIPAAVFVGPQNKYDAKEFGAFSTGGKIAITTYNGIFNTNPRISNAQCIIVDDAHAAENYISDFWSLRIDRNDNDDLYKAIIDIVASHLPEGLLHSLRDDRPTPHERAGVGKLLQSALWTLTGSLRDLLSSHVPDTPLQYPWSLISEHLEACNLYLSWDEILLRPFSPPVEYHLPFWSANQRIYASATLGEGGELERITGVRKITRLSVPRGQRRTPGRRFILIPNLSLESEDVDAVVTGIAKANPRLLVLCPDRWTAETIKQVFQGQNVGKSILGGESIEQNLDSFTSQEAVLLLTNRYDGLDLPDESCRAMVVDGLPDATNLQERFLAQRLGATAVLQDRIRTRITQALGRCTRNDTDYAVVLLVGYGLARQAAENEFQATLPAELQAEFTLGINNSLDATVESFLNAANEFVSSPENRQLIEAYVLSEQEHRGVQANEVAKVLADTVRDELDYAYAAWNGEWRRAYSSARAVCDKLEGGREVRPYQALWFYFAANAALRTAEKEADHQLLVEARMLRDRAVMTSPGISWFAKLQIPGLGEEAPSRDELEDLAIEGCARELMQFGIQGKRFERAMSTMMEQLKNPEAKHFESGLEVLGRLLGFQTQRPDRKEQGAPDSVWNVGRKLFLGFEAKSDIKPEKEISISDCREVMGHGKWIRARHEPSPEAHIQPLLVTYQTTLDPNAKAVAQGSSYLSIPALLVLASDLVSVLRAARTDAGASNPEVLRELLSAKMRERQLLPNQLVSRLRPLEQLPAKSSQ